MSEVRPFTASDVPVVAEMFQRILRKTSQPVTSSLEAYLRELFLEAPDAQPDITSLIHKRDDGSVSGFVGVLPLARSGGEASVKTDLFPRGDDCAAGVVPDHRELDPPELYQKMSSGWWLVSVSELSKSATTGV